MLSSGAASSPGLVSQIVSKLISIGLLQCQRSRYYRWWIVGKRIIQKLWQPWENGILEIVCEEDDNQYNYEDENKHFYKKNCWIQPTEAEKPEQGGVL